MNRCIALTVLLAGLAGFVDPAPAAVFCVTNSAELQEALDLAEVNGENDSVDIAAGFYPAPNAPLGFVYDAANPVDGDDLAIALMGGWSANDGCAQHSPDASLTVLDGGGTSQVMRVLLRSSSNLTIRYLTFANGNTSPSQRGGGLYISNVLDYAGTLRIENSVFQDNVADFAGGLSIGISGVADARLFVVNNLLAFNNARSGNAAAEFSIGDGQVFFTNNTLLYNTTDGTGPRAIDVFGDSDFLIANNNLWGNEGSDLHLRTTSVSLLHNNIGVRSGDEPDNDSGNISVEPIYQDGSPGFTPVRNSPLVDAGITSTDPWYLAVFDLNAAPRVVGPAVDIGAYENERIFRGDFEELP